MLLALRTDGRWRQPCCPQLMDRQTHVVRPRTGRSSAVGLTKSCSRTWTRFGNIKLRRRSHEMPHSAWFRLREKSRNSQIQKISSCWPGTGPGEREALLPGLFGSLRVSSAGAEARGVRAVDGQRSAAAGAARCPPDAESSLHGEPRNNADGTWRSSSSGPERSPNPKSASGHMSSQTGSKF